MHELTEQVRLYFDLRGLKWPTFEQAMAFLHTELGEAYEVYLAQFDGWVRNHPGHQVDYNGAALGEELGDAIMMLIAAGIAVDVDPVHCLLTKMVRKLDESREF